MCHTKQQSISSRAAVAINPKLEGTRDTQRKEQHVLSLSSVRQNNNLCLCQAAVAINQTLKVARSPPDRSINLRPGKVPTSEDRQDTCQDTANCAKGRQLLPSSNIDQWREAQTGCKPFTKELNRNHPCCTLHASSASSSCCAERNEGRSTFHGSGGVAL